MRRAAGLSYKVMLGGVSAATIIWAALFYKNYGQADIPAFGDVARHLGYLRLILLRYLLVGGGLLAAWAAILYRKAPAAVLDKHKTVRQVRGH
ncbi:MAG TPA: hypothetical protein GXZ82_15350 [Firmicutes bacterium]|jgi:hypothetical protein|nr:hypothetical protein [Bacillota bacterium]